LPLLWRFSAPQHDFHDHELGAVVRHGFHALALDETRDAFAPVLWSCSPGWQGHVEQVWFTGVHGDIGGQLNGREEARPLANIPLFWMLERLEACGVPLPDDWRGRIDCVPEAPSVGTWARWGKLFLMRRRRIVGQDVSERLHPTAHARFPDLARRLEERFTAAMSGPMPSPGATGAGDRTEP